MVIVGEKTETDLPYPVMTAGELLNSFPKKPTARIDRALLNLGRMVKERPVDNRKIHLEELKHRLFCNTPKGVLGLLEEFHDEGYISYTPTSNDKVNGNFKVRGRGWAKIEELEKVSSGWL